MPPRNSQKIVYEATSETLQADIAREPLNKSLSPDGEG